MKIGIVTILGKRNFGAVMQAYAMIRVLRNMGHDVFFITPSISKNEKHTGYVKFQQEHFNLSIPTKDSRKAFRDVTADCDLIIAGSDQIWSRHITKLHPYFFADWARDKVVRASYAPSLGSSNPTYPGQRLLFQKYLRKFDYISIREKKWKNELEEISGKKVEVTLDPTQLLPASEYMELVGERPFKQDYIYVHLHHPTADGTLLLKYGNLLSKKLGLPIVHNLEGIVFDNQLGYMDSTADPTNPVTAIYHSSFLLTQAFHALSFGLIFKKPFLQLLKSHSTDHRVTHFLKKLGLSKRIINPEDKEIGEIGEINWVKVDSALWEMRKSSLDFLYKVTKGKKVPRIKDYFVSGDPFTCYGCMACQAACPVGAISTELDDGEFAYPRIDNDKCIDCGKCHKVCPYNTKKRNTDHSPRAYLCFSNDPEIRKNSSSGGIFYPLAQAILAQDGYVVGVRMNKKFQALYDIADDDEGVRAFRYSKYVEPQDNDIFAKTLTALKTGKPVLFTGTPCKIAGLKAFLGDRVYSNLVTVDLLCNSMPSPLVLREWLKLKEKKQGSKLTGFQFRSPKMPFTQKANEYRYANGTEEIVKNSDDLFKKAFSRGIIQRKSCYACEFTRDNKIADLTIGDFWGYKEHYDGDGSDGVSCLKVNTPSGAALFERVKSALYCQEQTLAEMYRKNTRKAKMMPIQRGMFFNLMAKKGFEEALNETLK